MADAFKPLEFYQRLTRPELEALQFARLKAQAERLWRTNPFYRERWEAAKVSPGEQGPIGRVVRLCQGRRVIRDQVGGSLVEPFDIAVRRKVEALAVDFEEGGLMKGGGNLPVPVAGLRSGSDHHETEQQRIEETSQVCGIAKNVLHRARRLYLSRG